MRSTRCPAAAPRPAAAAVQDAAAAAALHRGANEVKERFMKAPLLDLVRRWHATARMPWRCCEGQTTTLSPFFASLYACHSRAERLAVAWRRVGPGKSLERLWNTCFSHLAPLARSPVPLSPLRWARQELDVVEDYKRWKTPLAFDFSFCSHAFILVSTCRRTHACPDTSEHVLHARTHARTHARACWGLLMSAGRRNEVADSPARRERADEPRASGEWATNACRDSLLWRS
jgi:hypothetical protein